MGPPFKGKPSGYLLIGFREPFRVNCKATLKQEIYLSQELLEGVILQGVFSFYPKAEPIAIALAFLLSLSM